MNGLTNGDVDEFTHNVAIQLSRAMNLINPNDTLAKRGTFMLYRMKSFMSDGGSNSHGYCEA